MPSAPSIAPPPRELAAAIADALGPADVLAHLFDCTEQLKNKPDLLHSWLRHLQLHPRAMAEIAQRSYWHNNGFAKIILAERGEYSVRLHIWPEGTRRQGDSNPHGHRWDFASWIALGPGMTETHFTETDHTHPEAKLHIRCDYGHVSWRHSLRPRGRAWLRPTDKIVRASGSVYVCTTDILHTVAPLGRELMATVVVQGRTVRDTTEVYLDRDREQHDHLPISAAELSDLFLDVADRIVRGERRQSLHIAQ